MFGFKKKKKVNVEEALGILFARYDALETRVAVLEAKSLCCVKRRKRR